VIGAQLVDDIGFLREAVEIVRSHHERWDGTGYPDRLRGEEIPLAARVFAVADVLDALTSKRPYRPASSFADARKMIEAESGTHFDPQVIAAFAEIDDQTFARIRAALGH
jgi:HD-GYP domain-containing protein (c-di-GMP phosphodiesterase class II)